MPAHRAPHQGTLRLRGRTGRAVGQQPRRAQPAPCGYQPQDQRRHPVGTWYREQDDAGIHLRHLARTRPEPPRRLPPTAHFPSNLNSYTRPPRAFRLSVRLEYRLGVQTVDVRERDCRVGSFFAITAGRAAALEIILRRAQDERGSLLVRPFDRPRMGRGIFLAGNFLVSNRTAVSRPPPRVVPPTRFRCKLPNIS